MVVCPACDHSMTGNPAVCEACGEFLPLPTGDTLILEGDELKKIAAKAQKAWRSAQVGESRTIRVHIAQAVLSIHLPPEKTVSLGRVGEAHESKPDIDLAQHKALKGGVSRLHAALRFQGDMVQVRDLESTNGTFLNGQRVSAKEWRIMRDGDELRLGNLTMALYFDVAE